MKVNRLQKTTKPNRKMKPSFVIIGLGNPGAEYAKTRHNAGFTAVNLLAEQCGTGKWLLKQKFLCDQCEARIIATPTMLIKPTTFMNRSGECARKVIDYYDLDPSQSLLIICDDIDLEPGTLRIRHSGSAGTHNGLHSIVDEFGEEFPRIRIGVGKQKPGSNLSNYVLSAPSDEERKKINEAIAKVPELVRALVLDEQSVDSSNSE